MIEGNHKTTQIISRALVIVKTVRVALSANRITAVKRAAIVDRCGSSSYVASLRTALAVGSVCLSATAAVTTAHATQNVSAPSVTVENLEVSAASAGARHLSGNASEPTPSKVSLLDLSSRVQLLTFTRALAMTTMPICPDHAPMWKKWISDPTIFGRVGVREIPREALSILAERGAQADKDYVHSDLPVSKAGSHLTAREADDISAACWTHLLTRRAVIHAIHVIQMHHSDWQARADESSMPGLGSARASLTIAELLTASSSGVWRLAAVAQATAPTTVPDQVNSEVRTEVTIARGWRREMLFPDVALLLRTNKAAAPAVAGPRPRQ